MRAALAVLALVVPSHAFGLALEVPLAEVDCGGTGGGGWLCYQAAFQPITTTVDDPTIEIVIHPIVPEGYAFAFGRGGMTGHSTMAITYAPPMTPTDVRATVGVAFLDADGVLFGTGSSYITGACDAAGTDWVCQDYGIVENVDLGDPTIALSGPITAHVSWRLFGAVGQPTTSELRIDPLHFSYALQPIPEPGAALLIGLGLACLARPRAS